MVNKRIMLRQVKLSIFSFSLAILINYTLPLRYEDFISISFDLSQKTLSLPLKCKLIEISVLLPLSKENKLHRYIFKNIWSINYKCSIITVLLPIVLDSCSSSALRTSLTLLAFTSWSSHSSTFQNMWPQGGVTPRTCRGTVFLSITGNIQGR